MNDSRDDFIATVQKFVARESVTPSAMRNQGVGVLHGIHAFLDHIDLSLVSHLDQAGYSTWLDRQTKMLLNKWPCEPKAWGAARKALNLFMRTALYNKYLSQQYELENIEKWMEIPLDSAVTAGTTGLKKIAGRGRLPQWPGLKKMTAEISERFQTFAAELAINRKISRVHLDMELWLKNR